MNRLCNLEKLKLGKGERIEKGSDKDTGNQATLQFNLHNSHSSLNFKINILEKTNLNYIMIFSSREYSRLVISFVLY